MTPPKNQCRAWPCPWPSVTKYWSKSGNPFKSYRVYKTKCIFQNILRKPKVNAGHGHTLGHLLPSFGPNPAIHSRVIVFKKMAFSNKFSEKKVMDGPSQKSMQVMAIPLAICNPSLVQIRPSVQELSCLQAFLIFWPLWPWPLTLSHENRLRTLLFHRVIIYCSLVAQFQWEHPQKCVTDTHTHTLTN